MKKAVILSIVALALLAMPAMAAVTVAVSANGFGTGGTYPYAPYTVSGMGAPFGTFCLEHDVVFYPNPPYTNTYTATIDDVVMYYGTSTTKALAIETKQLYAAYLNGVIGQTDSTANALQNEIWAWEGQGGANTGIHALLDASQYAGWQNVQVLNLWSDGEYKGDVQSMLAVVPAPGAILLGSLGVSIVGFFRKRFN